MVEELIDDVVALATLATGIDNPWLLGSVLVSFMVPLVRIGKIGYRAVCWLAPSRSDLCIAICDALEDGPVRLDQADQNIVSAGKVTVNLATKHITTDSVDVRGVSHNIYAHELLSSLDLRRVMFVAACAKERVLTRHRRDAKRKAAVMVAAWRDDDESRNGHAQSKKG